jgi:hypothetical protein
MLESPRSPGSVRIVGREDRPAPIATEGRHVTLGPLEYIVIGFQGNNFDGSIAREIGKVVENGTIRIVDALMVVKSETGDVAVVEIDAKSDPRFATFAGLLGNSLALFTPEDIAQIVVSIPENTSALVILFEHHWAVDVKIAMEAAGGFLVSRSVIPPEVLEELADELEAHQVTAARLSA